MGAAFSAELSAGAAAGAEATAGVETGEEGALGGLSDDPEVQTATDGVGEATESSAADPGNQGGINEMPPTQTEADAANAALRDVNVRELAAAYLKRTAALPGESFNGVRSRLIGTFGKFTDKVSAETAGVRTGGAGALKDSVASVSNSLKSGEVKELKEGILDPLNKLMPQLNRWVGISRDKLAADAAARRGYVKAVNEFGSESQEAKEANEALNITGMDLATDAKVSKAALARGVNPGAVGRLAALASATTVAALTTFFIIESLRDEGCWKWEGGAKKSKVIPTAFNYYDQGKQKYCACGTGKFGENTLTPVAVKCPGGKTDGVIRPVQPADGTYPPCLDSQYPVCNVNNDGTGTYYSYYNVSATSIFNNLIDQGTKIIKDVGSGIDGVVKWVIVVICVLICLFLTVKGVIDNNFVYGVGVLIIAGIGAGGYYYL